LKVLIVSYYWPPSGGSGVQRWMYFSNHLKQLGVEVEVVTINSDDAAYSVIDTTLMDNVKEVPTHRTSGGFQLLKLYSFIKSGSTHKSIPAGNLGNKKKSTFDKIASQVRANLFVPDARIGWNKQAIPVIKKLIQEKQFDIIITTGPPHSTHLIGASIKKEFDIKWLADFRDPWREVYYNSLFKKSKRADKKDAHLEKIVLEHADIILTVGPSMGELLKNKLTSNKEKVKYILNGFDESKFNETNSERYTEFTIAHIGLWSLQQAYQEITHALTEILTKNPLFKIRFILVGNVANEIIEALQAVPHLILDIRGKVSHQEALQEMKNADLLLNCLAILPNSKLLLSGKLMEYLASGNTSVVIGPKDGDAGKIIDQLENAFIFEPNDFKNLTAKILELYNQPRNLLVLNEKITRYSRKNTAKELYELLKNSL